jgi:hypothetical protein
MFPNYVPKLNARAAFIVALRITASRTKPRHKNMDEAITKSEKGPFAAYRPTIKVGTDRIGKKILL